MKRTSLPSVALLAVLVAGSPVPATAGPNIPEWVRPAADELSDRGLIDRAEFEPNRPMRRADFAGLIEAAFGGGYGRTKGRVKAGELGAVLVRKLGYKDVAVHLDEMASPAGWSPERPRWFGTEIVVRELGLRHNRPTEEDGFEASAAEPVTQADIVWAVWRALQGPSTYAAEGLRDLTLPDYDPVTQQVIAFALGQVGQPYVWAGEWTQDTDGSYPFGAQAHGGFDCSGFAWYVLRAATDGWAPVDRPYEGWSFEERSSRDMAKATPVRIRFRDLIPGDVAFFSEDGRDARAASVFHAGIYIGNGWMIHSSGSRAGVSISYMDRGTWWFDRFAWARRVIELGE